METLSPDGTKRVVLLWIGRLGDVLVATPLMAAVRKRFPKAKVALVTGDRGEGAARLCPDVDEVLVLRRFHRPLKNMSLAVRLRGEEADLLVDLNSAFSRAAWTLAALARARVKLAFRRGRGDRTFTRLVDAADEREHMLDRYARLAAALEAPYEPKLKVRITDEDRAAAETALRGLDPPSGRTLVGLFPGNFKKLENRWPEEKFAALAGRLAKRGDMSLFFLAGPGEEEPVRDIAARLDPPAPVLGPLPLGATAALLSRIGLLVTNATGTSHLAASVGTPSFWFLSRYTRTVWFPRQGPHFHVTSDSWESCRETTVDRAYAELDKALGTLAKSR